MVAATQSHAVARPLVTSRGVQEIIDVLRMLDAMGLLPIREPLTRIDHPTLRRAVRAASSAGIGRDAEALMHEAADDPERLHEVVSALRNALEDSPVPQSEIRELLTVFDPADLGGLVNASPSSLRRYALGSRTAPDHVAARLHWVAKVVADLRGSYNEAGIRRWFERRRVQLGDRPPRAFLLGEWDPDDDGPRAVRALARSLVGSVAT